MGAQGADPTTVSAERPSAGPRLADFGVLTLRGVAHDAGAVTLLWQDERPLAADYTVFVHALDAQGKVVAQDDAQPAAGAFPTSTWRPDDVISDRHPLTLPPQTTQLEIGLYRLKSGQRLALVGGGDAFRMSLG